MRYFDRDGARSSYVYCFSMQILRFQFFLSCLFFGLCFAFGRCLSDGRVSYGYQMNGRFEMYLEIKNEMPFVFCFLFFISYFFIASSARTGQVENQ